VLLLHRVFDLEVGLIPLWPARRWLYPVLIRVLRFGFRVLYFFFGGVLGLGVRVSCLVSNFRFRLGCRMSGFGPQVSGFRFHPGVGISNLGFCVPLWHNRARLQGVMRLRFDFGFRFFPPFFSGEPCFLDEFWGPGFWGVDFGFWVLGFGSHVFGSWVFGFGFF